VATLPPSSSLASAALARQARELFVAKGIEIFNETVVSVRQKITALLDKSANAKEAQDRRDAWVTFQKSEAVWMGAVAAGFKKAMRPSTAPVSSQFNALTFELMGNEVMDNKILSSRLALRILDKASWELNDLTLRIRHLDNLTELDKRDVFKPEACAQIVIESWMAAGLSREAWLSVQDVIHLAFGERMVEAYHVANELLVARGVMAEIDLRAMVRRTPSAVVSNSGSGSLPTERAGLGDSSTAGLDAGQSRYGTPSGGNAGFAGGSQGTARQGMGSQGQGGQGQGGQGQGGQGQGGQGQGGQGQGRSQPGQGMGGPGQVGRGAGSSVQQQGQVQGQGAQGGGLAGHPGRNAQSTAGNSAQQAGVARAGRAAVAKYAEASHEETRMMTSATPLARAKMRAQGVIGQLKRMLTDKVAGFDDTRSYAPSPQLAAAMAPRSGYVRTQQGGPMATGVGGAMQGGGGAGVAFAGFAEGMRPEQAAGALRNETDTLKKAASTTAEKATIEIVALLFQSILAEDRIPPVVRVWFARLQMPVLRLALSEPEFFGSLQHPARRLIDRMGSCVLGFDANVGSAALETEIKRVVQVIEQYPETGRRVFQLVYDEFQKFLSKFLTEGAVTQRVVSVAQQMEQKETAAIQYIIELRKMFGDMTVRDEIREFIFKVWAEVLAVATIKQGAQHAGTISLKQVAADLVWAASAKPNRADRTKVINELPALLKRMRAGMTLLGFDTARQDEHIKVISDTLADAFMSKTETVDAKQIEEMSKRLKNLEDFVSEDDDVGDLPLDAESLELMLGIDTTGIDIITTGGSDPTEGMRAWAMELDEGSWFNLDHNSRNARVQYAWRSKRGQLHLFAAPGGKTYLFQVRRLASYLQAGLISPVEDEALTVRATRDALTKIDANPERLLATNA
jgi:Protein of unknown function (DUF1631)